MDILAIFSSIMRHKLIVAIMVLLTCAGVAYVAFFVQPEYETSAVYVLVDPNTPTDAEVQADPSLGKLNDNNPLLRVDSDVLVEIITERMTSDAVKRSLIGQGADDRYQVEATNVIGSGQVIQITGTGATAADSTQTLTLVSTRMQSELTTMQEVDNADPRYLIETLEVSYTDPQRKLTGTLRSLIVVAAAGLIVTFGAISIAEALPKAKKEDREKKAGKKAKKADPPTVATEVIARIHEHGDRLRAQRDATGDPTLYRSNNKLDDETTVIPRMSGEKVDNKDDSLTVVIPKVSGDKAGDKTGDKAGDKTAGKDKSKPDAVSAKDGVMAVEK